MPQWRTPAPSSPYRAGSSSSAAPPRPVGVHCPAVALLGRVAAIPSPPGHGPPAAAATGRRGPAVVVVRLAGVNGVSPHVALSCGHFALLRGRVAPPPTSVVACSLRDPFAGPELPALSRIYRPVVIRTALAPAAADGRAACGGVGSTHARSAPPDRHDCAYQSSGCCCACRMRFSAMAK